VQRRSLLKGAMAMPLAYSLPAIARQVRGHEVAKLEVFRLPVNRRGDWLVLRLHTSDGLVGHGDASHSGNDAATVAALKQLLSLLQGESIFEVERFRAAARKSPGSDSAAAVVAASALEHCLWDLAGQALGVPTHVLFGGALRPSVDLYANINRSADPRTPAGFAAMAEKAVTAGFSAIKLAPFDAMPANLDRRTAVQPLIDQGVACAAAVRQAIGPHHKLLIDAHSRFTRSEGEALAKRLAPLDLFWLEEVTPAEPIEDLVAINRSTVISTAGGESVRYVSGFYDYIRSGAVDIAMPDIKACGGLLELKKIAAIAEGAGMRVSPHGPASPVGGVAAAHVAATLPNFDILEHAFGEVPWRADLTVPPEPIEGGKLLLSTRSGLGISLNEGLLASRATAV
jgi:galactonate dehydratase